MLPSASAHVVLPPDETMELPAFAAPYPRIINPELIAPVARAAMETIWRKGDFPQGALEIYRLKNAFVVDEELVFDGRGQFVSNCVDYSIPDEVRRAMQDISGRVQAGTLLRYPGLSILAKKRAPNNYGHFLLEMLPLAFIGRILFGDRDPLYLLHRVSPPTEDVVLRSFRLLKFDLNRLLMVDYRAPIQLEELVFFKGLTEHGRYMSPLAVQIVESMAHLVPEGSQRRIFIKRVPGWQQGRTLSNEEEICRRLSAIGYQEVEPGGMSLEQQISAFRGAEHVVGVAGAAMTNIVFCKPGTKVTLLVPAAFPDTFFWFIATHRNLDYTEIRGAQHSYDGLESWKAGFSIQESDIRYLERQA
ncbi:MAG TPA: glycosyltransferase family 61 protein [Acetobacteraceae bacterium]|nr:glycosyltransferase family 61 protein [Acetobacteraceae bacterium]